MIGNVWEWTRSLYRPYPYDSGDGREGAHADGHDRSGDYHRVARGVSFSSDGPRYPRAAYRGKWYEFRPDHVGVRLVVAPFFSDLLSPLS